MELNPSTNFDINSHKDILVEILKRLDGKSLGIAACVCRQWRAIAAADDAVWEHVCFRHVSPPGTRHLVLALGGYKRLYLVCLRPLLRRLRRPEFTRRVWTSHGAQLLLSLFCVDYYENLGGGGGGGSRIGSEGAAPPSSLMFLCKPVNV
uniref:F-box domain-containing protein n=1 Tax=Opuntia streptacantha TaxID=393608 RepID=A0A7C9DAC4_OPUST